MKSLYKKLSSKEHLLKAWKALNKSNKSSHGIDDISIEQFGANIEKELTLIEKQLRDKTYSFQKFRGVTIPKPGSLDRRPIQVPAVRDRVVMKALSMLIEGKLRRFDLPCSYAYIEGRSIHKAIARVHEFASAGNQFVLEADISNFFGAVEQSRLLKRLHSVVRSRSLDEILDAAIQNEIGNRASFEPKFRDLFPAATSGIPQGGVLSPKLANLYLSKFDAVVVKKGLNLVRYADDFVIMCATENQAREALIFCRKFLKEKLGLDLKDEKTRVVDYRGGFDFLGFRVESGKHSPSKKSVNKLKERLTSLCNPRSGHTLFPILVKIRNILTGWHEAYRRSELGTIPQEINLHIVALISTYLAFHKVLPSGKILNSRQLRILGIPRL
jgi:RNA-directed DNA polymerase